MFEAVFEYFTIQFLPCFPLSFQSLAVRGGFNDSYQRYQDEKAKQDLIYVHCWIYLEQIASPSPIRTILFEALNTTETRRHATTHLLNLIEDATYRICHKGITGLT